MSDRPTPQPAKWLFGLWVVTGVLSGFWGLLLGYSALIEKAGVALVLVLVLLLAGPIASGVRNTAGFESLGFVVGVGAVLVYLGRLRIPVLNCGERRNDLLCQNSATQVMIPIVGLVLIILGVTLFIRLSRARDMPCGANPYTAREQPVEGAEE